MLAASARVLPPAAGAEIDHRHAWLGTGEQRHDLRYLVLDLDEAGLEGLRAAEPRRAGQPQSDRRQRYRLGLDELRDQGGFGDLRGRLQGIDPEIDGGALVERRDLRFQALTP